MAETQWSREGEMWTNELRTERAERVGPRPPGRSLDFTPCVTGSHWKVLNRGIDVIYIFKSSLINQLGGCGSDPRENGGRLGEEELNLGYSLGQK